MKSRNKRMKNWSAARRIVIAEFWRLGIVSCEFRINNCEKGDPNKSLGARILDPVHRNKRVYYYSQPELLKNLNEVALGCRNCHDKLERNRELTESEFVRIIERRNG